MRCFVGLDLSLSGTGIVAIDDGGNVLFRDVCGHSLSRKSEQEKKTDRLVHIVGNIVSLVKGLSGKYDSVLVGIENYAFGRAGSGAVFDLGELNGSVKLQLRVAFGIVHHPIAVSTARKSVFGKGNFKKDDVRPELLRRGFEFVDDNDADAYVIAECLRRKVMKDD